MEILPTRHKGKVFKLLLFIAMMNDKMWLHRGHRDLEEDQTTNNPAAFNFVRIQTDVHM